MPRPDPVALTLLALLPTLAAAQAPVPPAAVQIAEAVRPAPKDRQEGATVLGYRPGVPGLVTLRGGTNDLICLADDPAEPRFHVACYQRDLEPFMRRGRELRAEEKEMKEVEEIRNAEIEAGTLRMPSAPTALYELFAPPDSFVVATREVKSPRPVYVLYIPYATEATTGLSQAGARGGMPWIMYPGKPWAHVMITP